MSKLKIHVVLGSTREARFGDKPARWITDFLNEDERIEAELLDLRDWPLELFNRPRSPASVTDGEYGIPLVNQWAAKVAEADGFVFTAAEYNHGYSAVLKNALDAIYREWNKKPVTFVGYGNAGGARAIEQLRQVAVELQMAPIKHAVHLPSSIFLAIMKETAPVDPKHFESVAPAATALRENLVWWATALRAARHPA